MNTNPLDDGSIKSTNGTGNLAVAPESQINNVEMSKVHNPSAYQLQRLVSSLPKPSKRYGTKSPYAIADRRAKAKNERKVRKEQKLKAKKKK